jgi:hypothetical protein
MEGLLARPSIDRIACVSSMLQERWVSANGKREGEARVLNVASLGKSVVDDNLSSRTLINVSNSISRGHDPSGKMVKRGPWGWSVHVQFEK